MTTTVKVNVFCAATSLQTIDVVSDKIYNLGDPALELIAPIFTAQPVVCAFGKKITVTPVPAPFPPGFTFNGQILSVY